MPMSSITMLQDQITANFLSHQANFEELMRSAQHLVKIDVDSIEITHGAERANMQLDDSYSRETVTAYIADMGFLEKLSELLGVRITRLIRKVDLDIALCDIESNTITYPDHLRAYAAEDELDIEDYKRFGHALSHSMFFEVNMWGQEFKVDAHLAFQDDHYYLAYNLMSLALSIETTRDAVNAFLKDWNGTKEVQAFHKGFLLGKQKAKAA